MVRRSQRGSPPGPQHKPDTMPPWGAERHSGEGSASALEILQKLEKRRVVPRPPADPPTPEDEPQR